YPPAAAPCRVLKSARGSGAMPVRLLSNCAGDLYKCSNHPAVQLREGMTSGIPGGAINKETVLLLDAVADLAPAGREAYYHQHGIAPLLRAEVESLLSVDPDDDTVLVDAVAEGASRVVSILRAAPLPERCGPFQPTTLLGQGGMGGVWLAERV